MAAERAPDGKSIMKIKILSIHHLRLYGGKGEGVLMVVVGGGRFCLYGEEFDWLIVYQTSQ